MQEKEQKISGKLKKPRDEKVIFVGSRPFMTYVTALVRQVTTKNQQEIKISARGKWISRAVDIVEVAKNRFLAGQNQIGVKKIEIGSEKLKNKEGREVNVSTIDITISQK